jgi:hypothetical protein
MFVGADYTVGDGYFDQAIVVRGRSEMIAAHLDSAARNAVMGAVGQLGIKVRDGKVTFTKAGLIRDKERLLELTRQRTRTNRLAGLDIGLDDEPQHLSGTMI